MHANNRVTRAMRIVRAAAVLFACVTGLLTWSLLERGEKLALKASGEQVERAVSAAETDVNRSLVGLDMFLADMARWTQHMPADPPARSARPGRNQQAPATAILGNATSLNLLLRAALNQNLLLRDVALLGENGEVRLSARASTPRLGMELPPDFLASVLAQPFPALVISSPVAHSLSSENVLYMARSVRLSDGTTGAVVAEVHGPLFSAMLDSGVADSALVVTFERGTGQLLASFPAADNLGGRALSPNLDQLEVDGTARRAQGRLGAANVLLAVRPTLYPGLSVSASLPLDNALSDWQKDRVAILAAAAAILALTGIATLATHRYMQRVAKAQAEIDQANARLHTSNAELTATLEALPDLLFELDEQGTYLDYRAGQIDLLAVPPQQLLGHTVHTVLPPAAAEQVLAALAEAGVNGHSFGREIEIPLPQGDRWFELSVARKRTADGQPQRFIVISRDITERKEHENELQLAALVYESSSEGMAVTDASGNVITINPAFTHITGYTPADVVGKNLSLLNSGRQNDDFYREMWAALHHTGRWHGELWNRRKNGDMYAEALSINTITTADGTQARRIALFSDITQRKTQEELIWNQANYDTLTGLPNRRMFREHLDVTLANASHSGHRLALMFLDLDRFKEINDTHGHDAGDVLLQTAAQRLRGCVRETDMVARLGGDEFTLILTGMDSMERLDAISHALLTRLAEPFHLGKEIEYLSASIGITLAPDDGTDSETLIKQADQAMYAAKRLGRNRCERFTLAMQEATLMRSRIARDLRSALSEQQFWLAYQPIVDLRTGAVHKAEALIRWQHPIHGLISPATFIPIAEEAGTIHEIGRWVFETAAQQVATWQTSLDPAFQVSVNKSPAQFKEGSLKAAQWNTVLHDLGLEARSVVLEITEGLLMDASATTREHLSTLHAAGVQISLDDFGTGYSALSYLHQFDLDYLKIDQSFVRNLHATSKDLALCKATIVMAHELGMKVVAEGIETEAQRDLLTQAGCDLGQGYLFAKPLPVAEFEAWVKSNRNHFFNS